MFNENRRKITDYLKLYLILETDFLKVSLKDFINQVTDAGVTAIQLRNKSFTVRQNYEIALQIKGILQDKDVLFVINDRLDLAKAVECNNIHLGIKDIPANIVKQKYSEMIIGYSCNNTQDIEYANSFRADYIGIGPAFDTSTKKDLRNLIGSEGIKKLLEKTNIPAVAIGGINENNINKLAHTAVSGFAISSYICSSDKPYKTTNKIRQLIDSLIK
jgi:thiamine-phosphate pyrophosphorylase